MSSRYNDNRDGSGFGGGNRKGPRWMRLFGIILSIVLAVVVVGGALILNYGSHLISLTNYVSDQEVKVVEREEELPSEAVETVSTEERIGTAVSDDQLQEIHEAMKVPEEKVEQVVKKDEEVYNILLVGVDRRDKSWNGNSDAMMLVSLNFNDKRVSVVSLMRDTYVEIPGVGYNKLNNAYARGGGPLLTATISDMYNVDLTRYAAVDFENLIEIIDALGGIDMEWTDAEVTVANGYMVDMCDTLGIDVAPYLLPGGGEYHCMGVQAVAYARNRYVGNSDYARTERQRYVLTRILERIKEMSVAEMTSFITKVLPLVTHNLKTSDIWELVSRAPEIMEYNIVMDRIPYDGLYDVIYVNGQDMLVPNWEQTVIKLHNTIYGDGQASENSDNDVKKRTEGNNEFSYDFEDEILKGKAQAETPFVNG